ncbi:Hypothetical protein, putative [Bodo saltans]|uniref:Uncharacterized protein n=1 Tax=Bodo saltans TaxID=75058 RepID=A0A0S4JIM9_BODSA|nr:Hypothetical protein, putative [Bodo saltans]|eukprot:CUG89267.1 Hypothetical protein, putative [Bodo saltans]
MSQPNRTLSENDASAPGKSDRKRSRDETTEASHRLLVKFLAELIDGALRYEELGMAVNMDQRAGWVQGWVQGWMG